MKRVLVAHSYFYRFDPKQWKAAMPYPPLMTIQAAACLREKGYEISFFDTNLRESPAEIEEAISAFSPDYVLIFDDGFNYLSKMCLTRMREAALKMAKLAADKNITTIICSSDATDQYRYYLENGMDYVLLGEGEQTLIDLLETLETNPFPPEDFSGVAYHKNGEIISTGKRPVMNTLDDLPDPAWDLVDMKAYRKVWMENHGYFSLNIATTRGCPYKCNWCAKPIYGNRYHARSPRRVADEIRNLMNSTGVSHFWICDDIFGLKPGWVEEFRDILRDYNIRPAFKIQSRADLLQEEATVKALTEAGLSEVWIGVESGSQKILDAMDKGITIEQVYRATSLLKKSGVKVAFFLQFGYLGETLEDIGLTLKLLRDLMPEDIGVSISYPLPGTKFYEKVKAELEKKSHWEHSDDLAMMYTGTYSPEFYRMLHRYVHKTYRSWQQARNMNPAHSGMQSIMAAVKWFYFKPASLYYQRKMLQLAS